jgi:cytosine/adenosine deaminase-related metal-dependent hydrolase
MKHNSRSIAGGLDAIRLVDMATRNGARSLGLQSIVGQLTVGRALDFVAFNINSTTLNIDDSYNLIDAIVFGAGNLDIETVCIDGQIRFATNSQHDVCSKSVKIHKIHDKIS